VAVATMGIAAPPSRLRRLLFRSPWRTGRLTLARTAGLGQEPFQLVMRVSRWPRRSFSLASSPTLRSSSSRRWAISATNSL